MTVTLNSAGGNTEVPNTSGAPIYSFKVASTVPYIDLTGYLALNPSTQYIMNDCNVNVNVGSGGSIQSSQGKVYLTYDKALAYFAIPASAGKGTGYEVSGLITTPASVLNPLVFPAPPYSYTNQVSMAWSILSTYVGVFTDGTNYYCYGGNTSAYLSYCTNVSGALGSVTNLISSAGTKALIHGCYGAGRTNPYVYVGTGGLIYSGATGTVAPTSRTSGTTNNLYSVVFAASLNLYVAVGQAGTILTSTDGATWTAATSGVATDLYGVTWTGSYLCAVGASGVVLTSTTGTGTWTTRTTGAGSVTWQQVASTLGNTRTVALSSAGLLWACTDGIGATWTQIANFNVTPASGNTPIFSTTGFSVQGYNGILALNSKTTLYMNFYDTSSYAKNTMGLEYGNAGAFINMFAYISGGYSLSSSNACVSIGTTAGIVLMTASATPQTYIEQIFPTNMPTQGPVEFYSPRAINNTF